MPLSIITQNQLENVVIGLTMTTNTLQIIADTIQTPFLDAIINTTQAVLQNIQLLEKIHKLLNAIMILHIKSDAGGEMPIEILDHVRKFTEYWPCSLEIHYTLTTEIKILHKIYTFVEAQQKGNRVKSFFQQGEDTTLLKDCQAGIQQSFDFFQMYIESDHEFSREFWSKIEGQVMIILARPCYKTVFGFPPRTIPVKSPGEVHNVSFTPWPPKQPVNHQVRGGNTIIGMCSMMAFFGGFRQFSLFRVDFLEVGMREVLRRLLLENFQGTVGKETLQRVQQSCTLKYLS
ncbi:hypothetical protein B0H14DRAFT_3146768 [Mycena olivaceomarginata]|nr:hypothetical protein B0H14DRAFT_3146768 [Mycena olivaceomarginata]